MTSTDLTMLNAALAEANRLEAEAIETYGEGSREARFAKNNRMKAEGRLATATFHAKESERKAARTPAQIVDEVMGR